MFIPISDDNEEGHSHHHEDFIHYGIILTCLIAYAYVRLMPEGQSIAFMHNWLFEPANYLGGDYPSLPLAEKFYRLGNLFAAGWRPFAQIIISAFMHADPWHIFGNMFLLWMLGDNVEYAMGHIRYLFFYLCAALFAIIPALLMTTTANYMGSIGASGAVMGVAGAYMFYFPKARVNLFYFLPPYWVGVTSIPARVFIGFYAFGQIYAAYAGYGTNYDHVGVTHHVMGFLFGLLFAWPLRKNWKEQLQQPRVIPPYRKTIKQAWQEHDHWGEGR